MNIILAADHAGFAHKESVKRFLQGKGLQVLDVGAHRLELDDDYPTYMAAAALKVAEDPGGETKAVIFGGSGQGEAIVANRFPGVRAVVWYGGGQITDQSGGDILSLSRQHNDANVLSIGARFVSEDEAVKAVDLWLTTSFDGADRNVRRIAKIDSID